MCTCNTFGCNANDDCDYCSKIAQLNTINHILKCSSLQRQNVMIVEMMINVPMKKIMDNLELVLLDQCVIILQDVSFVFKCLNTFLSYEYISASEKFDDEKYILRGCMMPPTKSSGCQDTKIYGVPEYN